MEEAGDRRIGDGCPGYASFLTGGIQTGDGYQTLFAKDEYSNEW